MISAARQQIAHGPLVIGASEMGAVLGLSPYRSPIEVWQEKLGLLPRFEGNAQTDWGQDIEPAVRAWYVRTVGEAVYVPPASLLHQKHSWMRATPDGIVLTELAGCISNEPSNPDVWRRGFEAKKAGRNVAHYWGDPGTDEVPLWYLIQCQQGMAVTGLSSWDLAASIAGEPPEVYRIQRDDEIIEAIVEAGERFVRCVETRTEPDVDGSDAYADYIARRYPWSREDFVKASDEIDQAAERLCSVRDAIKELEGEGDALANQIRLFVADAAGVLTRSGRFTYKPRKGAPMWKAVAEHLASRLDLDVADLEELANARRAAASRPLVNPRSKK